MADLPSRTGYFVGYLVAQRAGTTRTLAELAHLDAQTVRGAIETELDALGRDGAP